MLPMHVIPADWIGPPHDGQLSRPELLHELFEAQADARPDEPALLCAGDQLTYAQLDRKANRLAHVLRGKGVGKGSFVGLLLPRSMDVYVALLAILKAGAAYVPLDPDYPADRVSYILGDCAAQALVTVAAMSDKHAAFRGMIVRLDE